MNNWNPCSQCGSFTRHKTSCPKAGSWKKPDPENRKKHKHDNILVRALAEACGTHPEYLKRMATKLADAVEIDWPLKFQSGMVQDAKIKPIPIKKKEGF